MNCRAMLAGLASRRAKQGRFVYTLAVCLALNAAAVGAQAVEEIDDLAGQIQYAFYIEDPRALEAALERLEALAVPASLDTLKSYHLAYGAWRLAEIRAQAGDPVGASSADKAASAQAAKACAEHAAAASGDARAPEAYAIAALCEGFSPNRPAEPACRGKDLRRALALAPNNPRVRLIAELCAKPPAAPAEVEAVVALFAQAPARRAGVPDWGYAEALALLGARRLTAGDPLGAREALEQSLVIAPDYRRASLLLRAAAHRPD